MGYNDKYIEEGVNTKFRGLQIDNHLNWESHIDQLIPALSRACYAVRSMLHFSNTHTLKTIYFDYFRSLIAVLYGLPSGLFPSGFPTHRLLVGNPEGKRPLGRL
jgi:hypothetical protein